MSDILVYILIGLYFFICIVLFGFSQYHTEQTKKYAKWCFQISDERYKESMDMLTITVDKYTQIVDKLKCCANCKHHTSNPMYCDLTNTECYAEYICSKWEIKEINGENNGTR